jgi:hypothetical protein
MQIHISRNDEQFGPYSREEVASYLEDGSLVPNDFAWHEDLTDWKPLSEVVQVPAPAPVQDVPSSDLVSDPPVLLSSPPSQKGSASYHLAKIAIVILLIGAGGSYYLVYGAGRTAYDQWAEKAVNLYHRLVAAPAPGLTPQKESALPAAASTETTPIQEQDAAPSNVATPVPESPKRVDWGAFVTSPNLWPKVVVLTTRVSFPVVLNGRVAGSITMPGGTPVNFDGVLGSKIRIEYQGGVQTVSPKVTDLEERLLASGVTKHGMIQSHTR